MREHVQLHCLDVNQKLQNQNQDCRYCKLLILMAEQVNVDAIWVMSVLDMYMVEFKNNGQVFCSLFEKKKTIIQLLKSQKINAKNYKKLVGKAYQQGNEKIKNCAQNDIAKLKDAKDEKMIDLWFKEMVDNTGKYYEDQQKLYQKYQNVNVSKQQTQTVPQPQQSQQVLPTNVIKVQPQKPQQPPKSIVDGCNIDEIFSFKIADSILDENQQKKQLYERVFERKQKLLDLVSSKTMTAQKYKSTLQTYITKIKNQSFISDMKMEIEGIQDFHEGDVEAWFKELIKETKDNVKNQKEIYQNHKTGKTVKSIAKSKLDVQSPPKKSAIKSTIKSAYNISQINSFKLIQAELQNFSEDKIKYKQLLNKKIELLQLCKKGALNGSKYKAMISKNLKEIQNQQMKEELQFELSDIEDLHDGDVGKWFKDIIQNANLFLQDQKTHLKELISGKIVHQEEDDLIQDEDDQKNKKKQSNIGASNLNPSQQPQKMSVSESKQQSQFKQVYSLKALDQWMDQNMKNPQIYCQLFQRKLSIFQMMKKGEITAQKYKQLQKQTFKTTSNQKLKDVVQMQLQDLTDMAGGDVNQWFKDLIDQSGQHYQEQEIVYGKFKGVKAADVVPKDQTFNIQPTQASVKINEKPNIADVICFTAIEKLFVHAVQRKDIVYYKDLSLKRQKLIDLVTQNKLISSKYRQINKASAGKTDNTFLKATILQEEKRLANQFKGNQKQWYDKLFKVLSAHPPELVLPESNDMKKINSSTPSYKIQYLIRKMATYESLYYYYKKNKLPIQENRYLVEYEKRKKQVVHSFELIQKDDNFDVFNLAAQMFPEVNNDVFFGDNLQAKKQKIPRYIDLLEKEIAAIKAYTSSIKKLSNTDNLQKSKQQTAKCQQNIAYLKSWPNGSMVAFPTIIEEKVQKLNMDVFKLENNQIDITINGINGMEQDLYIFIYVVDTKSERYTSKVGNGNPNIHFTAKIAEKQMAEMSKGDKKHIFIRFCRRGFFGGLSLIAQDSIQTIFTRTNIIEGRAQIGNITVSYVFKVQRPVRPIITEILHVNMTTHLKYKHQKFFQEQLIKKYVMYSSPTPSEFIEVCAVDD